MKRVAVVGYTSMVGGRLCNLLTVQGATVIKCGRAADSDIAIDLTSSGNCFNKDMPAVDALFHCAAGFFDDSWEGRRSNEMINACGCYWILQLAEALQCRRIINAGTVSSVDGVEETVMSSYGFSKARGEDILEWGLARCGGRFVSVRFPQLYDEYGQCCRHQQWFGRIVAHAAAGKDLRMPKSLGPRNFLHVADAAGLLISAWRHNEEGRLNIAHPQSLDYGQIAAMAYSVFGNGGSVVEAAEKQPFRKVNFPDGGAALTRLEYGRLMDMRKGLSLIQSLHTQGNFGPMDVQ